MTGMNEVDAAYFLETIRSIDRFEEKMYLDLQVIISEMLLSQQLVFSCTFNSLPFPTAQNPLLSADAA